MSVELAYAKNGMPLPTVVLPDGTTVPLHSSYNPEKEASGIVEAVAQTDLILFIGAGWGYLPEQADNGKRKVVVLIFPEEARFYETVRPPFLNRKNIDVIETSDDDSRWCDEAASLLAPFCYRSYRIHILPGWEKAAPARTRKRAALAEALIGRLIDDAAVFVRFAKLWHTHFFKNIALPRRFLPDFRPVDTIWIAGASPEVESMVPALRQRPSDSLLIAADTVFPFLTANGIEPDYAVTIDAQPWSLSHFTGPIPAKTALVADLTAQPSVAARFDKVVWCAGGHPLCELAARRLNLPPLNTSGGNVAVAALSFARLFQPRVIRTVGIDFRYPNGKTYSRGTWLPLRWQNTGNRLRPADTENEILLQSRPYRFEKETANYTPELFLRYREAWKTETESPPPRFERKPEQPQRLADELNHLPAVCTAPLRCREFYKKLN